MSQSLKEKLIVLRGYYETIDQNRKSIASMTDEIYQAERTLSKGAPKSDYAPEKHLKEEEKRQTEERKEKEKKIEDSLWLVPLLSILIVFVYAFIRVSNYAAQSGILKSFGEIFRDFTWFDFLTTSLTAAILGGLIAIVVGGLIAVGLSSLLLKLRIKIELGEFSLDEALLEQARIRDQEATEAERLRVEAWTADESAKLEDMKAKYAQQTAFLEEGNQMLLSLAETFFSIPEDFRNFRNVCILIESYDACRIDWCDGKDPSDIDNLCCYCRATNTIDKRRNQAVSQEFFAMQSDLQRKKEENARFAEEQAAIRAKLNREAERLNEESKKMEELYKEIKG